MRILIESILGGHSPTTEIAQPSQFRASLGIDPAQPIDDADGIYSTIASGVLRPSACQKFSDTTINAAPLWMVSNPKDANTYVLDSLGSSYTISADFATVTALSDAGHLTSCIGNGAEYYDNYIYFAKNTDICRYGPLNGVPTFNGTYWTGTLSKTALSNTTYPSSFKNLLQYPNHVMKRHSDGRLYFTDVVGNQGYVHYIKTTKTTVEGDTNDSSTYQALAFGFGLWPTALESYGSDLAIALYEGSNASNKQQKATLAFWDTTSSNSNKFIKVEFPDQIITAMKNVNGNLYVVSGNYNSQGFRVSVFLGGYSFQEVFYSETGEPCLPGAIDGTLNRVIMGSFTNIPESDGCVYSIGLQKEVLGKGMFNIMRATGANASTAVTAVTFADNTELGFLVPVIGWTKGSGTSNNGLDKQAVAYGNANQVFWSQTYRIGRKFRIQRIRIPLAQAIAANMTITPKIYCDNGVQSYTLATINNTTFPNGEVMADIKVGNVQGFHNFWLELKWTGSSLLTVNLPIEIMVEVIDE